MSHQTRPVQRQHVHAREARRAQREEREHHRNQLRPTPVDHRWHAAAQRQAMEELMA
jgi:hypothetical protein